MNKELTGKPKNKPASTIQIGQWSVGVGKVGAGVGVLL